jgi:DNA-binding response OmpR family regulator
MNKHSINILLIDDEPAIAETVIAYAVKESMAVDYAKNGEDGIQMFEQKKYDLIVMDWMLPGISGPEIIKLIRKKSEVPILMVSARNDESDIVIGLELGADDYITKPFGPREMIARIKSLLRRQKGIAQIMEDIIISNLKINFEKQEIFKDGRQVKLTPNEFRILKELYTSGGTVVSREKLMENALGYHDFNNDKTLDTHIKNLRQKVEDDPQNPQIILTVRGSGFKIAIIAPTTTSTSP